MSVILRLDTLREIERRASCRAASADFLMEQAGSAAATVAMRLLTEAEIGTEAATATAAPLIVCGPGNNGGDGFVVARLLKQRGLTPVVVFDATASGRLPPAAATAYAAWLAAGGACVDDIPAQTFGLAIDALFGIGLARPLEGRHAELVARINALTCPVLALDIPSGLDSETGGIRGCAVRADHTATFIALKPGLLTNDGPDHCGDISLHELGLGPDLDLNPDPDFDPGFDPAFDPRRVGASGQTIGRKHFSAWLQPRRRNSHKGSHGSAAILGGAAGMAGAALLAARAALKLGAGRVYVGMLERLAVDPVQPELMLREPGEALQLATALAIGPGLGLSSAALELLSRTASADFSLVLDADALNLLAAHPVLFRRIARRTAPTLLTPHPAEAARLLGTSTAAVQSDRLTHALELARRANALIVLKGCGSIVATPAGRWWINTSGNPGLATGGSGDVLGGIIVALLAQGWPALEALLAAVHLHGVAADTLARQLGGTVGIAASELIDAARTEFNRWIGNA